MFTQFFFSKNIESRIVAWSGLVATIVYTTTQAYIKYCFNAWYGRFWDLAGSASSIIQEYNTSSYIWEESSGDQYFRGEDARMIRVAFAAGEDEVFHLLRQFSYLCIPTVIIPPLFRYLINHWCLLW